MSESKYIQKLINKVKSLEKENKALSNQVDKDMTNKLYYEQKEVRLMFTDVGRWVKEKDYQALETELETVREQLNIKVFASNEQRVQLQKLKEALDIIMAEINSTPMLAQYFDLRIIRKANELLKKEP